MPRKNHSRPDFLRELQSFLRYCANPRRPALQNPRQTMQMPDTAPELLRIPAPALPDLVHPAEENIQAFYVFPHRITPTHWSHRLPNRHLNLQLLPELL